MKRNSITYWLMLGCCSVVLLGSCKDSAQTPKPRGYYRIALEEKSYRPFDSTYPYTFEYPTYGTIHPVTKDGEQYWANVDFPAYNATIYLSYKRINGNFAEIIEDNHKMSYRHTIKADAMTGTPFVRDDARVYGMLTEIDGDVASSIQFYVTDSVKNFLRGSLYFNSVTNSDSLAPLVRYFKTDIQHLMETLEWKTK